MIQSQQQQSSPVTSPASRDSAASLSQGAGEVLTPRMLRAARRDSATRHESLTPSGMTWMESDPAARDSIAVDSMARVLRGIFEPEMCTEADAPRQSVVTVLRIDYMEGIEGTPRPELPGYNSGLMSLLLIAFLFLSMTFRYHTTFLKTFTQDLWSVRKRSNAFEDHTVSETRILATLIMLVCICEGLLLFIMFRPTGLPGGMIGAIGVMIAIAVVYYLWQLVAYTVTGYAFTDQVMAAQWIKGFNASQALLGLALTPPALWVAFHPASMEWVGPLSILLYVVARIIFICKGFRIFYDNFSSLVYFILYLCTLEIVPLIAIFRVCRSIPA